MNKMMGFYELKDSGLPSVRWKEFERTTSLDRTKLWTIRCAVQRGSDLNLPRLVTRIHTGSQDFFYKKFNFS